MKGILKEVIGIIIMNIFLVFFTILFYRQLLPVCTEQVFKPKLHPK